MAKRFFVYEFHSPKVACGKATYAKKVGLQIQRQCIDYFIAPSGFKSFCNYAPHVEVKLIGKLANARLGSYLRASRSDIDLPLSGYYRQCGIHRKNGTIIYILLLSLIVTLRLIMGQIQLLEKVKRIPPAYQQEVEDFIDFVLSKRRKSAASVAQAPQRAIGLLKGKLQMASDFDEPLDDFKDYM